MKRAFLLLSLAVLVATPSTAFSESQVVCHQVEMGQIDEAGDEGIVTSYGDPISIDLPDPAPNQLEVVGETWMRFPYGDPLDETRLSQHGIKLLVAMQEGSLPVIFMEVLKYEDETENASFESIAAVNLWPQTVMQSHGGYFAPELIQPYLDSTLEADLRNGRLSNGQLVAIDLIGCSWRR